MTVLLALGGYCVLCYVLMLAYFFFSNEGVSDQPILFMAAPLLPFAAAAVLIVLVVVMIIGIVMTMSGSVPGFGRP